MLILYTSALTQQRTKMCPKERDVHRVSLRSKAIAAVAASAAAAADDIFSFRGLVFTALRVRKLLLLLLLEMSVHVHSPLLSPTLLSVFAHQQQHTVHIH